MILFFATVGQAHEYLVHFKTGDQVARDNFLSENGGRLNLVSEPGQLYKWTTDKAAPGNMTRGEVEYIEENTVISLMPNPSLEIVKTQLDPNDVARVLSKDNSAKWFHDNPAMLTNVPVQKGGVDPLLSNSWGIFAVGADKAWAQSPQGKEIVVAVIDTGIDYTHPDLVGSLWTNKKEIPANGIDDDSNGYIDDVIGWDFEGQDNKPYDLSMGKWGMYFFGGNPGHGTHVSGVIAAQLNNAEGIAGVAPQAKIMALRFLGLKGQGNMENAVKAIDYAVANGANIINASWGGPSGGKGERALQDAIHRAEAKGVLFVAAAGNGRGGKGFDNDTDAKPMSPASYDYSNMIAVAAIDSKGALASFSNFGAKSVKVGAPGVNVLSTVPGGKYQDTVMNLLGKKVTWNGTSMASPFVAGALAVLWSTNPTENYRMVRSRLLQSTVALPSLAGKVSTNGRIDLVNAK